MMYEEQVFNRCIYAHDKNIPNPKMTVLQNLQMAKTFYDPGDLENKAKVKLMTCN